MMIMVCSIEAEYPPFNELLSFTAQESSVAFASRFELIQTGIDCKSSRVY